MTRTQTFRRRRRQETSPAQIDMLAPMWVDLFAGGGGFSTGAELAIGHPLDVALNHDHDAVAMHKANHPYTRHMCQDVYTAVPLEVTGGRHVIWAHFSPDCTHFSRAKGGTPVSKKIRGLAWVIIWWAMTAKPDIISFENVPEFRTWGPLIAKRDPATGRCYKRIGNNKRTGKPIFGVAAKGEYVAYKDQMLVPDKKREGQTYRRFVRRFREAGYEVEFEKLNAADFGAATNRTRLFGLGRRDGKSIVWPQPTHAHPDSEKVRSGALKLYRTAAEIINWSLPCPSIFASKDEIMAEHGLKAVRPLAENTLRRVICGVDKFAIKSDKPFILRSRDVLGTASFPSIVEVNHTGGHRGQAVGRQMNTVTGKNGYGVVDASLSPLLMPKFGNSAGNSPDEPIGTTTAEGRPMLISPVLSALAQTGGSDRGRPVDSQIHTTVSKAETVVVTPSLSPFHAEIGQSTGSDEDSFIAPCVTVNNANNNASGPQEPVRTITTGNRNLLTAPHLIQYHTETGPGVRGQDVDRPVNTLDTSNRYGMTAACMAKYYSACEHGQSIDEPKSTTISRSRQALVAASMVSFHGAETGQDVDKPVPATLSHNHEGVACAHITKYFSGGYTGCGVGVDASLPTVTAVDHNALVRTGLETYGIVAGAQPNRLLTTVVKVQPGHDLKRWPKVRGLLNKHCGYSLADDEVLLIGIGGIWYFIADIGLRMLTPRELYNANGFPPDYIIDHDDQGKPYPVSKQVARCGNAVPPPFATALIRANAPEYCVIDITTMAQLNSLIAV